MTEVTPFDKLALLADLDGTKCELDHSGDPDGPERPAVDYLVVPVGDQMLTIPICEYCQDELRKTVPEWYLFYCLRCGASRWIPVQAAKCRHEHITWKHGCPECMPVRTAG